MNAVTHGQCQGAPLINYYIKYLLCIFIWRSGSPSRWHREKIRYFNPAVDDYRECMLHRNCSSHGSVIFNFLLSTKCHEMQNSETNCSQNCQRSNECAQDRCGVAVFFFAIAFFCASLLWNSFLSTTWQEKKTPISTACCSQLNTKILSAHLFSIEYHLIKLKRNASKLTEKWVGSYFHGNFLVIKKSMILINYFLYSLQPVIYISKILRHLFSSFVNRNLFWFFRHDIDLLASRSFCLARSRSRTLALRASHTVHGIERIP